MPVPASAQFDVSFVDMDGDRRREPLSSCWMVPFERVLPVRAFGSYNFSDREHRTRKSARRRIDYGQSVAQDRD